MIHVPHFSQRCGSSAFVWRALLALRAALISTSCGTTSRDAPLTSTVRQSESPHTEVHRLAPTLASIHSSRGLPAIQMRLDAEGSSLKFPRLSP